MKRVWLGLPVAVWAIPMAVQAQEESDPVVTLSVLSNWDDKELIRSPQPYYGSDPWLSSSDFPPEAFEGSYGSSFTVELLVNPDGGVAACGPLAGTGSAYTHLAERACELLRQRARFVHGIDRRGRPTTAKARVWIWMREIRESQRGAVPPPAPPPPGFRNSRPVLRDSSRLVLPRNPELFEITQPDAWLDIDDRGRVTRCMIRTSSGTDRGDAAICKQLSGARFDPARDPQGKPVNAEGFYVKLQVSS